MFSFKLILVRKFSICMLWWHLTFQHKHCWAGITTFTAFSHGRVGGWTETTNPQTAALVTPAVAFLPGKNQQENNHLFSHQRKTVHFCQTSGIRMEIGQIKSSAAGPKTSPSWTIFPNGKYEPRDHRFWKREWYAVNNDHLRPCGNQATVNLLLQTERIYLSIPLWQFPFQNEVICAGRLVVKALAATSHHLYPKLFFFENRSRQSTCPRLAISWKSSNKMLTKQLQSVRVFSSVAQSLKCLSVWL